MSFITKMLLYLTGNVSTALVSVIFLPLYTSRFIAADFGSMDLSMMTVSLLISFFVMEIWTALLRFMYDDSINNTRKIVTNILFISFIMLVPFCLAYIIFAKIFNFLYTAWLLLYGCMLLGQNIYQYYLRGIGQTKTFVLSGILITGIQIMLNFLLICVLDMGVISLIISQVVSRLITIIFLEFRIKLITQFEHKLLDKNTIALIFKFSFPIAINSVAYWGMTNVNGYFAALYIGTEANGYIAVANKFVMVFSLLSSVFILAWQESSFQSYSSPNRSAYYSMMLNYLIFFAGLASVLLIITTQVIFPYFIGSAYITALTMIPLFYLSACMSLINGFFGQLFSAEKRTDILLYSTLVGALVNILCLVLFLPIFKILAIPICLCLSISANVFARYIIVQKVVRVQLNVADSIVIALFIGCSLSFFYLQINLQYQIVIVSTLFLLVLFYFRKYVAMITQTVRKFLQDRF